MKKRLIFPLALCLAWVIFTGCGTGAPLEPVPPAASAGGQSAPAQSAPGVSASAAEDPPAPKKPEPVYGGQIADGVYGIQVSSSSSMFRVVDARLTVANGGMTCVLTLSGKGYEKLYMGAALEALAAPDADCAYFVPNDGGQYTYQVPVPALDQEVDCAAWSFKKQKWYDRTLVFESASLPATAFKAEGAPAPLPADGRYEIAVSLTGGSGRAQVRSPAALTVKDGAATATVVWGSPYYEKMTVGGVDYAPMDGGGNAAFQIPVPLDEDITVTARTTAMSAPHDIEYTLRFDSAAMKPLENS